MMTNIDTVAAGAKKLKFSQIDETVVVVAVCSVSTIAKQCIVIFLVIIVNKLSFFAKVYLNFFFCWLLLKTFLNQTCAHCIDIVIFVQKLEEYAYRKGISNF